MMDNPHQFLDHKIFERFGNKCVRCQRPAVTIHEIVPRSRTKDWANPENQVPLCAECHSWAHKYGAKNSAGELKRLRRQRLNVTIS